MLASATYKLTNLRSFYNKELLLSHMKVQCGVLGLPLSGDSQTQAPSFTPPASPARAPTDDLALCSLQPLARAIACNCMWNFAGTASHQFTRICGLKLSELKGQGLSPLCALGTGKGVVIMQQTVAFRFRWVCCFVLRMSMGYIYSQSTALMAAVIWLLKL